MHQAGITLPWIVAASFHPSKQREVRAPFLFRLQRKWMLAKAASDSPVIGLRRLVHANNCKTGLMRPFPLPKTRTAFGALARPTGDALKIKPVGRLLLSQLSHAALLWGSWVLNPNWDASRRVHYSRFDWHGDTMTKC